MVHNGDCTKATKVTSNIKSDPGLVRSAEDAGKKVQKDIDHLTDQLQKGNLNPGIGTKTLFKGVMEARSRHGARVYFRKIADGIEIIAKSCKRTQEKVIEILRKLGLVSQLFKNKFR